MSTETVVCFDLDGTLLDYDREYDAVLTETFERHLDAPDDTHVETHRDAFFETFDALEPDPYRAAMAAVAETADADADPDAMVATWREVEYAATTVSEATRDCLETLAETDSTTLAVVTDGLHEWQVGKLDHHDLGEYFETVVTSYEVGGHKADGEPYDALRERVSADEYVMIGDSYDSDVEGARAAGFVPIHYEDDDGPEFFATLRAML